MDPKPIEVDKSDALFAQVVKLDKKHGIVFGFGIVCKDEDRGGDAGYTDLQKQYIPEDVMFDAAVDFSLNSRATDVMHDDVEDGIAVFTFPLTTEIAKALGIKTSKTGLLVGMKPSKETFKRFESGELTSFSIGGKGYVVEEEI